MFRSLELSRERMMRRKSEIVRQTSSRHGISRSCGRRSEGRFHSSLRDAALVEVVKSKESNRIYTDNMSRVRMGHTLTRYRRIIVLQPEPSFDNASTTTAIIYAPDLNDTSNSYVVVRSSLRPSPSPFNSACAPTSPHSRRGGYASGICKSYVPLWSSTYPSDGPENRRAASKGSNPSGYSSPWHQLGAKISQPSPRSPLGLVTHDCHRTT